MNPQRSSDAFAERPLEYRRGDNQAYSGLMLAARITLPHFSVSSAMNWPKSAGDSAKGVPPRSASRAFTLGSARPALISLLSLLTISAGVFLGRQALARGARLGPRHELAHGRDVWQSP